MSRRGCVWNGASAANARRTAAGVIALAVLVVGSASARAQLELGRVSIEYTGGGALADPPPGAEDLTLATTIVRAGGVAPVPLGRKVLLVGIGYTLLAPDASGVDGVEPAEFHEIGLSVGLATPLSDRWRLLAQVTPSLASDFRDLSVDAINVRALAIASWTRDPTLTLNLGVAGTYQLGRLLPLPVLGVRWQPDDRTLIDVGIPTGIRVARRLGQRFEVGSRLRLTGGRYQVGEAERSLTESVRTTTVTAGPTAAVNLRGPLWLELFAGYTLFRNFEVLEEAGDSLFDRTIENSFVVQTAIVLRPPRRRGGGNPR